jgi:hypothetical protein
MPAGSGGWKPPRHRVPSGTPRPILEPALYTIRTLPRYRTPPRGGGSGSRRLPDPLLHLLPGTAFTGGAMVCRQSMVELLPLSDCHRHGFGILLDDRVPKVLGQEQPLTDAERPQIGEGRSRHTVNVPNQRLGFNAVTVCLGTYGRRRVSRNVSGAPDAAPWRPPDNLLNRTTARHHSKPARCARRAKAAQWPPREPSC